MLHITFNTSPFTHHYYFTTCVRKVQKNYYTQLNIEIIVLIIYMSSPWPRLPNYDFDNCRISKTIRNYFKTAIRAFVNESIHQSLSAT